MSPVGKKKKGRFLELFCFELGKEKGLVEREGKEKVHKISVDKGLTKKERH